MSDVKGHQKNSKYNRLIIDTFIFALGNLGSKVILFFLVPLYTSCLSTEEYGTSELVFTVAQLLVPFVSLVIFDAVLRYGLSSNFNKQVVLKNGFVIVLIGSIATIFITPFFRLYQPLAEWRWYLCAYVILNMFGNVELNYLKLCGKNKIYALVSIIQTIVLALSNIFLLVIFRCGISGYLLSTILSSLVTVVIVFIVGDVLSSLIEVRVDLHLLKEMIIFSAPLILNNISWWVIQSSDKIMIEAMVGASALGLYTAATKIPSLINVIISIFSQAWGISSVKEFESSNDKGFYSDVFLSYTTIAFGATVCINMIVKPFMAVYVSESFYESWRFVPILLASASFSAVASYFGSLYGALKKSVNNMLSTMTAAIINIIVNYVFIIWFNAWGAIIGTIVAYVVLAVFRMVDVLRFIKFDPNWKNFICNVVIVLSQAVLVSLNFHTVIISSLAIVFFAVVNKNIILKITKTSLKIVGRTK